MGLIEKTGGRKWWGLVILAGLFGFVLLWLTMTGKLEAGSLGILVGAITGLKALFDGTNTANNKAALAAGKAKDEEATRLSGMSDGAVVAAAGAGEAVERRADGAVSSVREGVEGARNEIHRATNEAIDRLRGAATGGSDGGRC